MNSSRLENSVSNIKSGLFVQILNKLLSFAVRTVFIKCLNTEYLGINGLFTNILTLLSFTELGIGTAIIYSMYKPIAEDDINKINGLMNLYKKCYTIIGFVVFTIGLAIVPFMGKVIDNVPNITENINFIYVLFLFNTSISYFFTYKKSIIIAHQKHSIINKIDAVCYLIKCILSILVLLYTKNYIMYLMIEILFTISENIIVSLKADKIYPYLKKGSNKVINSSEKKNIFKNVKSLVVYQFGTVIMNGTDNILISTLINVSSVGLCSNYIMIITAVKSVIQTAFNGLTASVGNLNAIGDVKLKEKIFYELTYIQFSIYSFCSISFILLLTPVITIWIGKDYVLSISVVVALSISFFIDGLRQPGFIYRTTLGLFNKSRFTPYIGAISNIFFSIILCKYFGLCGIFFATSISQLISYSWIDPYLIHKYEFKISSFKYYKKFIKYLFIFFIEVFICLLYYYLFKFNVIKSLIFGVILSVLLPNILNYVIYSNSDEFNSLKLRFINYIKRRRKA